MMLRRGFGTSLLHRPTCVRGSALGRPTMEVMKAKRQAASFHQSGRCHRCWVPEHRCICAALAPLAARTRQINVCVAVHYKELRRSKAEKNTAKLLPMVLGAKCARLSIYPIQQPPLELDRPMLLLWPSKSSKPASTYREFVAGHPQGVTLLALDGTWSHTRAMARHYLARGVPCVHVSDDATTSRVLHRVQPSPSHVSTVEAVVLALRALGETLPCERVHQASTLVI